MGVVLVPAESFERGAWGFLESADEENARVECIISISVQSTITERILCRVFGNRVKLSCRIKPNISVLSTPNIVSSN